MPFTFPWRVQKSFLQYPSHPLTLRTNLSRQHLTIPVGGRLPVRVTCTTCNHMYNGYIVHYVNNAGHYYQLRFSGNEYCYQFGNWMDVTVDPQNRQVLLTRRPPVPVARTPSSSPPPSPTGGASTTPGSMVSSPGGGGGP